MRRWDESECVRNEEEETENPGRARKHRMCHISDPFI